ncbi:MAG TPA: oligosaccharide flippase family protein [Candidatus Paceibacterota bacterium]|nr:oligosaccharide flippase family protein [Candidatus Paceibacterota bacterium]
MASLQAGTFGATAVQGLAGIIIARLLQPQLFGVYSLAMSLASLIVIIVGFGLQDAVTTIVGETYAKEDRQGTHDAMMFLAKMSILVGVLSVGAYFVAPYISLALYHDQAIGFYASIIVFAAFISGTFFTFSTLGLQVAGKIKQMSMLGFVDQTIRSGLSLLLVFIGFGIFGAMIGHFIGAIVVFFISVVVWRQLRRSSPIFPSLRQFKDNFWRANLGKYFSFSAWIALDKNIASLYSILPILMIGLYASSSDVSYFKISFAYVNLALSLMAPISTLLNAEFPKMRVSESNDLRRNFLKVSLYSLALSTALTAVAIAVSPVALRILYGQSFLPGLKYVFGLFIYGAFIGIGVGLGPMWRAIDKVKISIVINIVTLAIGIPGGLWLIANYGVWGAVVMVSAWFTISHLVSFFYLLAKIPARRI